MKKIKSVINLLKIMLQTSYDTSDMIDNETKKLNKKSARVWIYGIVCALFLYLNNSLIGLLQTAGLEKIFLDIFFLILQILVLLQAILLSMNVIYCSEDIENYLCLPISNMKLLITKFMVMLTIIFGTELTIVLPSLYIYGAKVSVNLLLYCLLTVLALFLISIFLATIVLIVLIPVMRLFRFIKNRFWYQSVVVLVMTCIIMSPMIMALFNGDVQNEDLQLQDSTNYTEQIEEINIEDIEQIAYVEQRLKNANKVFIVGEQGVQALSQNNEKSFINLLKIFVLDVIALTIFVLIGRITYIKDVLWNLSLFDKKKNKKINWKKRCKVRNKNVALIINDIKDIFKNPTFFMNYIYNVFMILELVIVLSIIIVPIMKRLILENVQQNLYFNFEAFSIIIGIVQLLFIISPISLTQMSRHGKNAMFFKYIPVKAKTIFRLKNIPQIVINTLVIIVVLLTINYLFPEIGIGYLLLMFVVSMILNVINSYILLLIDLKRPQLYHENEISVVQQNDNKMFKYILAVCVCVILWYLYKITEQLSLNLSILIEIIVFSVIVLILEIIIEKKKDKLFEKIQ